MTDTASYKQPKVARLVAMMLLSCQPERDIDILYAMWLQDGSLRLYLCVLLRQNPIVTEAVCLQIGGNKFIDVYISELGMDRRIHIEHMLPAVTADFDKENK